MSSSVLAVLRQRKVVDRICSPPTSSPHPNSSNPSLSLCRNHSPSCYSCWLAGHLHCPCPPRHLAAAADPSLGQPTLYKFSLLINTQNRALLISNPRSSIFPNSMVDNLRRHVIACGLSKKIDLIITSPLMRTMQTAVGVFGGEAFVDGVNGKPLMAENTGNSGRPAISSIDGLPFVAVEACREHLGVHPCDRRRTIKEYQTLFPAVDFSLIESNEDTLWKPNVREPNEEVASRGIEFINWLLTRRETEIAVITHSGFLFHTLQKFGKDFHPLIKDEICKHFGNCELRSMVIIDKSLLGFRSDRFSFPGKIPPGLDLPSDIAHDKHPNATGNQ